MSDILFKYLAREGMDIYKKFHYILLTISGDEYYCFEVLVDAEILTLEEAEELYNYIQRLQPKEVFKMYEYFVRIIRLYGKEEI